MTANIDWVRVMFSDVNSEDVLEEFHYTLNNFISSRTFYVDFVGELYKQFLKKINDVEALSGIYPCSPNSYTCRNNAGSYYPNYRRFIGLPSNVENTFNSDHIHSAVIKSDFAILMELIYKDLSYIIMENMIDSNGNIEVEYNDNNQYVRGGYSLSSEIVQVNLDGFDKENNNLLLKFDYK